MPKVRANAAARWNTRTAAATPDYVAGVNAPRAPWQASTVAAAPVHTAAMQQALANNSFAKGVQKSSDAKWAAAAAGKGADRLAGGVAAAVQTYQTAVQPFTDVIQNTVLPPRGPKGDPKNYQRVQVMGQALNAKKKSLLGYSIVALMLAVTLVSGGILLLVRTVSQPARSDRPAAGLPARSTEHKQQVPASGGRDYLQRGRLSAATEGEPGQQLMAKLTHVVLAGRSESGQLAEASGGDGSEKAVNRPDHSPSPFLLRLLYVAAVASPLVFLGAALDTVSGSTTAPGATVTALTAATGDSFNVRNNSSGSQPKILSIWAKTQAAGIAQVTHASGADQVRDLRFVVPSATPQPFLPYGVAEPVQAQELLNPSLSGSAVGGQVEIMSMLIYYPDLPGVNAQLGTMQDIMSKTTKLVTVQDSVTATVAGQYGGARAINAGSDLLLANTWFAILGIQSQVLGASLTVRGPDFGNLRVGVPGFAANPMGCTNFFVWLAEQFSLPLIPCFNSANKAGTFVESLQDQALTAVPFSLMLAQLSGPPSGATA